MKSPNPYVSVDSRSGSRESRRRKGFLNQGNCKLRRMMQGAKALRLPTSSPVIVLALIAGAAMSAGCQQMPFPLDADQPAGLAADVNALAPAAGSPYLLAAAPVATAERVIPVVSMTQAAPAAPAAAPQAAAQPVTAHPASQVVEELANKSMRILKDKSRAPAARLADFRDILAEYSDMPSVARFVLGRHWANTSAEQREAYLAAFSDFMVRAFTVGLGGRPVQNFEILSVTPRDADDVVVAMRVKRFAARPLALDWRMRMSDGRYRIVDLSVDGISVAITRRHEFNSYLRGQGVDRLIARLQKETI